MSGVSEKQLVRLAGWPAGIDNQSRENALKRDDKGKAVIALREAENVDLDPSTGKPRRRGGFTPVLTGTRIHSLWRAGAWPFALYVSAGTLRGFRGDGVAFDILAGLDPAQVVSYEIAGERVFWTNGRAGGVVRVDGTAASWGCLGPAGQPALTAVDGVGGLAAGTYQVAITYALASGEESGTGQAALVDVAEGGGIALSAIPQPVDDAVSTIRVYLSGANGDVLYHLQDLAAGTTTAMVGQGRKGKPLDTQFMVRMPAGRYVRLHMGRLYVLSADGVLQWSEALRYGLTQPTQNRMRFGAGRLLEAVGQGGEGAGLFVSDAKRTYFLGGAPEQMTPKVAYAYAAVPGTAVRVDGSVFGIDGVGAGEVVYWMAANGVGVIGLPGGQIIPLRDRQTVAPSAAAGASLFREQDGLRQVVTTLAGGGQRRGLAISDRAVVTVERYDGTSLT